MDAYQRNRPNRLKPLIIYGLIFLVPGAVVFAMVQMRFRGLPPRYETHMTFRVDPHLSMNDAASGNGSGSSVAPVMDLDVRAVKIEVGSRERLIEALRDLEIYTARDTDEKRQLLISQLKENLDVQIDRETGNDAYLVTVTVTMPTEEPKQVEQLLRNVRQVYMKYNIEARITVAESSVQSWRTNVEMDRDDFKRSDALLKDFEGKTENAQLLGNPPPIAAEIFQLQKQIQRLDDSVRPEDIQARAALMKQLDQKKEIEKNTPRVVSRHAFLKEKRDAQKKRLKEQEKRLQEEKDYHSFLQNKAQTRFQIVNQPESKPVESEQSSRFVLGLALGVMAGLGAMLFCLLFRILGYVNDE